MDASFKGVSEKFYVSLLSDEGYGSERVVAEIGLEGVFISSRDTQRMLRKYPLNHISRWALRDSSLVLYTKTPVDVEEVTVTLQGDDRTIRSALDTLTSCCMQLVELLQNRGDHSTEANQTTTTLNALIKDGGQSKKASLPSAEDVEYWHGEEKAGWLQSQGDHIKTWRRRWFVLKQGYMFRFATPDVSPSTKPRGLVDLSKVSDVTPAKDATGRNNSLMLSTPTGRVLYVADSETEQVEWLSAIEGAVQKIVRQIAGVEDDPAPAPAPKKVPSISGSQWVAQLEKSYASSGGGGGGGGSGSGSGRRASEPRNERNTMVNIVGYSPDAPARAAPAQQPAHQADYGQGSSFGYDNIAGIAGIRNTGFAGDRSNPGSTYTDSFVKVDYPAYPSLTPMPAQPAQQSSHGGQQPHYGAGQKHGGGYGGSNNHGTYGTSHGQQQVQEYSASPYQPHGQPTSYSDYSAPSRQTAPSAAALYETNTYGYQAPSQTPHQAAYQQPVISSQVPSWQQLETENGQAYYYNVGTGVTQWERPAGFA